jgi:hypothetical protein
LKRLEVEFYDSNFMNGWEGKEVEDTMALATAIGYLKSEDDEQLTLVMAYSDYGLIFAKLTIPKGSIKSIKEVRTR